MSSNALTKTKAKKCLIVTLKKENKLLLKQIKKNCKNVAFSKTSSDQKEFVKYLLEFVDHKMPKQAKTDLEKKFSKDIVQIEYPFVKMKKESIKIKRIENKENGEKQSKKNKPFEIKLPKLILRNLSFKITEELLRKEMDKYGKVVLTSLPVKEDGKLKGFGFVQFSTLEEAKNALDDLNSSEKKLAGNKVIADWCIPKNIFKRIEENKKAEEKSQAVDAAAAEKEDNSEEDEAENSADEEAQSKPSKKLKKEKDEKAKKIANKQPKSVSKDVVEKRTVFIRNLSFDTSEEILEEAFARFGPVKHVKICMDPELERPKGTAFIQFEASEAAEKACAESNVFELDSRILQIDMAVSRSRVNELIEHKKSEKDVPKDKRNLALAKIGVIYSNSYEAEGVSKSDMIKRQKIEAVNAQKLKLLHYFVSPTRLSVHNIPIKCSDEQLRAIFERAIGIGENSRAAKKSLSPLIRECRIMRDLTRVSSEGVCKSKGYGFVEFATHELALKALHATNNNPSLFKESDKRLIVQFSIENMNALKKKRERTDKSKKKNFSNNNSK